MIFVDILKVHFEERPMVSVQAVHAEECESLLRWRGHEEEQAWCRRIQFET